MFDTLIPFSILLIVMMICMVSLVIVTVYLFPQDHNAGGKPKNALTKLCAMLGTQNARQ